MRAVQTIQLLTHKLTKFKRGILYKHQKVLSYSTASRPEGEQCLEHQNHSHSQQSDELLLPRPFLERLGRTAGFLTSLVVLLTSICWSSFQLYQYYFYIPEAVHEVWKIVKDDEWLRGELGEPLVQKSRWCGHARKEDARISFNIAGSKKDKFGKIHADLIYDPSSLKWDIVSMRFARLDEEAQRQGIAPDEPSESTRDIYFTSNDGPGTKTTAVPLEWMPTGVPGDPMTDDMIAARRGYSVIHEGQSKDGPGKCPYYGADRT